MYEFQWVLADLHLLQKSITTIRQAGNLDRKHRKVVLLATETIFKVTEPTNLVCIK